MKKMLLIGMVFSALALTSCKNRTCKLPDGTEYSWSPEDGSKEDKKQSKEVCKAAGGKWKLN